jgi:biopolymer transport protein ExbD
MKLKMSLPERPGWIFVIPGFDFLALLLALVMLSGVVAQESYVEIKLPPSEFRGVRLGDEQPVVVMLKSTSKGPTYYMSGAKIAEEDLSAAVLEVAGKRGTRLVAIEIDKDASMSERFVLVNILTKLKFKIIEGYRRAEVREEGQ